MNTLTYNHQAMYEGKTNCIFLDNWRDFNAGYTENDTTFEKIQLKKKAQFFREEELLVTTFEFYRMLPDMPLRAIEEILSTMHLKMEGNW